MTSLSSTEEREIICDKLKTLQQGAISLRLGFRHLMMLKQLKTLVCHVFLYRIFRQKGGFAIE